MDNYLDKSLDVKSVVEVDQDLINLMVNINVQDTEMIPIILDALLYSNLTNYQDYLGNELNYIYFIFFFN
jgi:hypothetical protein